MTWPIYTEAPGIHQRPLVPPPRPLGFAFSCSQTHTHTHSGSVLTGVCCCWVVVTWVFICLRLRRHEKTLRPSLLTLYTWALCVFLQSACDHLSALTCFLLVGQKCCRLVLSQSGSIQFHEAKLIVNNIRYSQISITYLNCYFTSTFKCLSYWKHWTEPL